jgi:hypothetical protein
VLLASLALFAHGIAFVALSIAVGRLGTPLKLAPRVASRAQPEHLQFVAPATPAPTLRNSAIGGTRPQRRLTADIPRGTLMQPPPTDTGASVTAVPLATSLPVDPRLLVVPGAANNIAVTRLRQVNAAIASRVRVLEDSVARARRRWTVGVDTAHRFGIANCGIVVDVICIPFGVGSMPNPATSGTGIDLKHAADEAEVRAAIARIRPTGSKSTDGTPEPTGP